MAEAWYRCANGYKRTVTVQFRLDARASETINPKMLVIWQGLRDSNPRPSVLETDALPTELNPYA